MRFHSFKNWYNNHPKYISLALSFFVMMFYVIVSGVKFDTNDDPEMMLINMGVFAGKPDIHNVYINYLVSGVITKLYSFNANIYWYELLTFTLLTMSLSVIIYFVIKNTKNYWIVVFFLLALLSFLSKCISNYQFTKSAFITGFAGIIILLFNSYKKENFYKYGIAILLLIISALIRYHAFFMMLVTVIPIITFVIFNQKEKLLPIASFLLIAISINVGLYKLHTNFYNEKSDWKNFLVEMPEKVNMIHVNTRTSDTSYFNNVREKIKWSENDFSTMMLWFYVDTNVYSISKFRILNKAYPTFKRNWAGGSYSYKIIKFFKETIHYWFFIILWFSIVLFYFQSHKKQKIYLILLFGYTLAFMFFMFYFLKLEARIFTPIVFALITSTFLFEYKFTEYKFSKAINIVIVLFLAAVALFYSYKGNLNYRIAKNNQDKLEAILMKQSNNEMNISLSYGFPFNDLVPFKNCTYLKNSNIIPISTLVCSPLFHQSYQRHGIKNLLDFMAQGKGYTFWVFKGNGIHNIEQYYLEHYHITLKFIKIGEVGNSYMYKPKVE